MKLKSLFSFLPRQADTLIGAVTGFCIIMLFARHGGIGISPDSVTYMSVAANIQQHGILKDFNGTPLIDFPAGYPFFLAGIASLTGYAPLVAGPILNGLLFAIVIVVAGIIIELFAFRSRWYKWILLACIAFSPSLLEIFSMLWSETVFIVLSLLFIIALYRYMQSHSMTALISAALLASLACVTRYAGIAVIATGGLLLLTDKNLRPSKKIIHLLIAAVISCLLPLINILYNKHAGGALTGVREKAIRSFTDNLFDTGTVFGEWLPFVTHHYTLSTSIAVVVIGGIIVTWLWRYFQDKNFNSCENVMASFFIVYVLFMIISASLSRYERLNNRLLSPAFVPFVFIISHWLIIFVQRARRNHIPALVVSLLFAAAFLYRQWRNDIEAWNEGIRDAGIPGYTEDQWRYSPTVAFIQQNISLIKGFTIYSNAGDAVYFFTGMKAELLPHKEFQKDVNEFLADKFSMVIWFDDGYNPELVDTNFLVKTKRMVYYRKFKDGAIYIMPR